MNEARIRTCSRNPLLRFLFVAIALLLRKAKEPLAAKPVLVLAAPASLGVPQEITDEANISEGLSRQPGLPAGGPAMGRGDINAVRAGQNALLIAMMRGREEIAGMARLENQSSAGSRP